VGFAGAGSLAPASQINLFGVLDMKFAQLGTDSVLLAPITAATTARTANLDCAGANYAKITIPLSAEVNTNSTNVVIQLSKSDDTVVTNFATFNASFNRTVDNAAATIATNLIDLDGRKRYLRLAITPDTTTNGAVSSAAVATLFRDVISESTTMLGPDTVIG
jgi:hypothetical protein